MKTNNEISKHPKLKSFLNGTLTPLPLPGVSGFDRQIDLETGNSCSKTYTGYFAWGCVAAIFPLFTGTSQLLILFMEIF